MNTKPFLHEQPDFKDLILAVSSAKGILPQLVEKDYWLMHCLWALQSQGLSFELKGGTSLSKGWKIIERFSEDVDIKIFPPVGMEVPIGKNHTKAKHRERRGEYFDWLRDNIWIPGSNHVRRDLEFDDHDLRNGGLRIDYPSHFEIFTTLKDGVLLEAGFDVTAPNEPIGISSWVYDFILGKNLDICDNRASAVPCYLPEYTLVEKLSAISKKYRQERTGKEILNFTRHYYDVFQLLGQKRVQEFLGTEAYQKHKSLRFQKEDEFDISKNDAFILHNPEVRKRYIDRYASSAGLYFNGQPSFDSIIDRIQHHAAKL